jgi:hypothetical protein
MDPLGLAVFPPNFIGPLQPGDSRFDCQAQQNAIDNLNHRIREAIRSESDINEIFRSSNRMNNLAFYLGDLGYAGVGGLSMAHGIKEFAGKSLWKGAGLGAWLAISDHVSTHGTEKFFEFWFPTLKWNFLNSAESAAEFENEMGVEMSEHSAEVIKQLQEAVRKMQEELDRNCGGQ